MSFAVRSWGIAVPLAGEELRKHNAVITYHQNVYSRKKEGGKREGDGVGGKDISQKTNQPNRYLTSLLDCLAAAVHHKLTKYQNLPQGQRYGMTIVSCYVLL